ncbi:WYL domain-containing protein [Solwaraspora sp. WMMD406]|uniref:helix-turn-helix transcriptional regulator n=1 Tax=Solwaraspora sp. WMMD406 TaxID=3016095 RepID=UPI0024174517|nr:WYL domain-containing protein [Solwaraspora sp. WMMD406]MDG4763502.1 WYL domain-containing protein [Solwaraspora sp. WMMD406]
MSTTSGRLLALLSLLQSRRDWPGSLLAQRLRVSPRTVRRDVDRLRELGYPITAVKGPDGGYRLGAGAHLPPLLFDDDQAVALAVALRIAATGGAGAGFDEAAARALHTVRQVMPARLRHRIDTVAVTAVERPAAAQVDRDVLLALSAATHAREIVRFDYRSESPPAPDSGTPAPHSGTPAAPRRVEPHHLVTWAGRWYLVAWDLDRADWRTFRIDRIRPRTPTGPRFAPRELPGRSVTAFITDRFRGGREWPCRGEVILHLPAAQVSPFARDGIVEELGPDRCRLTLGSWSWPGLAAAVGLFDADVEVVGPPELAAAFALLARRYAAAAGQAGDAGQADDAGAGAATGRAG